MTNDEQAWPQWPASEVELRAMIRLLRMEISTVRTNVEHEKMMIAAEIRSAVGFLEAGRDKDSVQSSDGEAPTGTRAG